LFSLLFRSIPLSFSSYLALQAFRRALMPLRLVILQRELLLWRRASPLLCSAVVVVEVFFGNENVSVVEEEKKKKTCLFLALSQKPPSPWHPRAREWPRQRRASSPWPPGAARYAREEGERPRGCKKSKADYCPRIWTTTSTTSTLLLLLLARSSGSSARAWNASVASRQCRESPENARERSLSFLSLFEREEKKRARTPFQSKASILCWT